MASEKFCFSLKLETGCLILGFTTLALSVILLISSFLFLLLGCKEPTLTLLGQHNKTVHHDHFLDLNLGHDVLVVVMCLVIIVSVTWMMCSISFICGILQTKPNYILTYFLYGIAMCFMFLLIALLLVISRLFIIGAVTFIFTVVYMKCLTSVYTAYDKMQRDKLQDEQLLITEEDFSIED